VVTETLLRDPRSAAAQGPAATSVLIDEAAPLPVPLKLVLISLFLPEAMSFFVAGLRLTVTRVIFLVLAPVLFIKFGQKVATRRYVFVWSDVFVPLASLWMFVGPAVTQGLDDALTHSGPVVLEYLIGYMATRTLLTRDGQALAFASFLCAAISVVVLDALLDTATGRYFTHELVAQITGYQKSNAHLADEIRFGLLRAAGPLEHPILLGFACGIGLLFASAVDVARRPLCVVACALGVLIPFSSAPEQSVIMGFGFLAYGRLTAGMRGRWLLIFGLAAAVITVVFLTVNSPFGHIIDAMTLDPSTGYYRLYIWNTVGPIILDNPYFGVSQESIDQVYEGSVDSLWLVLALLYGIPCGVLTGLAMVGACSRPTSGPRALLRHSEARLGTVLGIVTFLIIFAAFTVHFWGSVWILISLLAGLCAHLGELGTLNTVDRANGHSEAASFA
jgi:hypothetical protein